MRPQILLMISRVIRASAELPPFMRSSSSILASSRSSFSFEAGQPLQKVREVNHLPYQLKEFRLPVLEGVATYLNGIVAENRLPGMFGSILQKGKPAEDPVAGNRKEEERMVIQP